jgi:hypothetical protein
MTTSYELTVLVERYAVTRLPPETPLPSWCFEPADLVSVTRTSGELSIVCAERLVPPGTAAATDWRGLAVHGPFALDTVGVLATLTNVLAAASISLLAISTYDTDYLLVHGHDLGRAVRALRHAGHKVHTA